MKNKDLITLSVAEMAIGTRLDVFIAEQIADLSRSQVKRLIELGHVSSADKTLKASHQVEADEVISVVIPPLKKSDLLPEKIPLEVIFEDQDIIVINKSAGMIVHPAAACYSGTLVNALLAHCSDLSGIGGELKPGIVHRLDKGTSGVIVAAKNDAAHLALSEQFANREVKKLYCAMVYGSFKELEGSFAEPIGRSLRDRKKISSRTSKARSALTKWKVAQSFGSLLTWVDIQLHTGRTHQIRVHFFEAGHPLVGDKTYGGVKQPNRVPKGELRKVLASFPRPALHAARLEFVHPRTKSSMSFSAPLAQDLQNLLEFMNSQEL